MTHARKIATCLWLEAPAEEVADFYVSLFDDASVTGVMRPAPDAPAMLVEFALAGVPYQVLNGGPGAPPPSDAASLAVVTADQAETDRLWSALTAEGGSEGRCGWLKDRYGVAWQIIPGALPRLLDSENREAAGRAMEAMLGMSRLDVAALEAAYAGDT